MSRSIKDLNRLLTIKLKEVHALAIELRDKAKHNKEKALRVELKIKEARFWNGDDPT